MENIKQKIGDRIKEVRVEKKLSQESVAYNSGIERSFMTHIENGRRNVSVETLEKVLTGLEISFSDFFNANFFKNV
ncbi:helix-turn-helix transcriptional regulator [Chryseobacterium sp.]|uniref:helix-turn-helix domain-containing protein n=1 Tax=Chryseobacterium sp. TaxID=1871047 RepID=UPI000ECBCFEF|nr:helix-turn-helix transcriptional regulator [Chryseobacterium sp.]HCA09638.1 transcriptional regulator [Chryseobacterium sp.]